MSRFQFSHKILSFNNNSQGACRVAKSLCLHLFLLPWLEKLSRFQIRLSPISFPESEIKFLCKSEFCLLYIGTDDLNGNISPFNFFSLLKPRWTPGFLKLKTWLLEYSSPTVVQISHPLCSIAAKGRHKTVLEPISRDAILQFILLFVSQKSSRVQFKDHWSQLALNYVINPDLMMGRV